MGEFLRSQPALVVFLVIGVGSVLGRLRLGGVPIGASTGVLLGGLLLGHLGARGSGGSQSIGFMLFIYCVGLRAGPEFFRTFRENGLKFATLALVVAAVGVAGAVWLATRLGLAPGYGVGLLAGALTSTPVLVAAQDAVRTGMAVLPPGVDETVVLQNMAAAYAITYVVGMFGLLVLVALLPRVLRIDLKADARRLAGTAPAGIVPETPAPAGDDVDLVTFALGITAGIAVGLITIRVGGVPIALGTAGGLLLSGLVVGFLRTANPTFGHLPVGAADVLMQLGLQFFMANVGLEAGGTVVDALRATGAWLLAGGFVVMAAPVLVGFAIGRMVLGLEPVILLGALTGAMTSTPALDMVNRQADSPLPTVGYAGTYAFANVLLAVAGSLLMRA